MVLQIFTRNKYGCPKKCCKQSTTDITCAQQNDRLVRSFDLVLLSVLISCRVAVVFAIQSWLAESPEQAKTSATPAYFQVGMSGKSEASTLKLVANWL
jgi:hypothetical protein